MGNSALAPVRIRILCLAGVCFFLALILGWRFYVIQISRHQELLAKAVVRYTIKEETMRQRGKIYDADGNMLVGNMPRIYVVCSPYSIVYEPYAHLEKSLKPGVRESIPRLRETRRKQVAEIMAEYFGKSKEEFYAALEPIVECHDSEGNLLCDDHGKVITRRKMHFLVDKAAEPEVVDRFKTAMKKAKLSLAGFRFENIFVRYYPKQRMLANVLGYANVGKDIYAEQSGLERAIGKDLRAQDSLETYQRGGDGKTLSYGYSAVNIAGHDGDDIYLTVKETVQAILEEELDAAALEFPAESIYAVIVDPQTGNILAMSQRPNFDPGDTSTFSDANLTNKIAVNAYEPGSVMKPFTISTALDNGVVTPETVIDCGSSRTWYYGGHSLSDFRGYGEMTPGGILKKSSNIGTAKVALMMGDEMVYNMLSKFKFGTRSGLPFASESRGRLPKYPFVDKVTVTRAPIGYAVQVTALQLARGYCALANGGKMPELRLLDRRRDSQSGEFIEYPYKDMTQVFKNPQQACQVVDMLISVTASDGTGKQAAIPGYEVAGKTGTSQKLKWNPDLRKMQYGNSYRATFCGFVPARHPEFVMVITFDGVSGARHGGGNVAAPVFKRTMSRVLRQLNVRPDFPEQLTSGRKH